MTETATPTPSSVLDDLIAADAESAAEIAKQYAELLRGERNPKHARKILDNARRVLRLGDDQIRAEMNAVARMREIEQQLAERPAARAEACAAREQANEAVARAKQMREDADNLIREAETREQRARHAMTVLAGLENELARLNVDFPHLAGGGLLSPFAPGALDYYRNVVAEVEHAIEAGKNAERNAISTRAEVETRNREIRRAERNEAGADTRIEMMRQLNGQAERQLAEFEEIRAQGCAAENELPKFKRLLLLAEQATQSA